MVNLRAWVRRWVFICRLRCVHLYDLRASDDLPIMNFLLLVKFSLLSMLIRVERYMFYIFIREWVYFCS